MSSSSPVSPRPPKLIRDEPFVAQLDAARAGSLEARGEILQKCRAYLLAAAGRGLSQELRAKVGASDLVQEAMTLAHANFERFGGESEGELLAWLNRILERRVLTARRRFLDTDKRDVRKELSLDAGYDASNLDFELPLDTPTPGSKAIHREEHEQLQAALERLRPADREIIELRNLELLSFVAIGERLGRTQDAVRKQWVRAMERLLDECDE